MDQQFAFYTRSVRTHNTHINITVCFYGQTSRLYIQPNRNVKHNNRGWDENNTIIYVKRGKTMASENNKIAMGKKGKVVANVGSEKINAFLMARDEFNRLQR